MHVFLLKSCRTFAGFLACFSASFTVSLTELLIIILNTRTSLKLQQFQKPLTVGRH